MGVVIRIGIIIWTIIMLGLNTTLRTPKCLMVSDLIFFFFFGIGGSNIIKFLVFIFIFFGIVSGLVGQL